MQSIAVYCGASTGNKEIYKNAAKKIGDWLVSHDLELVYGGGGIGLMGILAKEVIKNHGQVHGIMPKQLVDRNASFEGLTNLTIVENINVRKQKMMDLSDGCLALPGGPGTLEEITEAFSWARLGDNQNPCVFYNVNGYYDPLKAMFDNMVTNAFLPKDDREKLLFSNSLDNIYKFMNSYIPPKIRTYKK